MRAGARPVSEAETEARPGPFAQVRTEPGFVGKAVPAAGRVKNLRQHGPRPSRLDVGGAAERDEVVERKIVDTITGQD